MVVTHRESVNHLEVTWLNLNVHLGTRLDGLVTLKNHAQNQNLWKSISPYQKREKQMTDLETAEREGDGNVLNIL